MMARCGDDEEYGGGDNRRKCEGGDSIRNGGKFSKCVDEVKSGHNQRRQGKEEKLASAKGEFLWFKPGSGNLVVSSGSTAKHPHGKVSC